MIRGRDRAWSQSFTMLYNKKKLYIHVLCVEIRISLSEETFKRRIIHNILWQSCLETMVPESVAAKIFKIGPVVFESWPFYHITLWSAFVSITKMNMMKLRTLKVWNAVNALSHYSVVWTFVVTCHVKCCTFRSKSRSKVKLNFGVIK